MSISEPNTSGHGAAAIVPPEVQRWNWGAFLLNWIWGIGNGTYLALLVLVPFVGFVMMFVLGAKGSEWAWRNRRWESLEQFRAVQRRWARWGLAFWIAGGLFVVGAFMTVSSMLKSSDAYQMAMAQVRVNAEVSALIGEPMVAGIPMGSVRLAGPRGEASLSFGISGPRGAGTVYVEATRDMGAWKLDRMVFEDERSGRRVDLIGGGESARSMRSLPDAIAHS